MLLRSSGRRRLTPLIGFYIRDTHSVRVVIRHDTRSWRGYRVHTAFPVSPGNRSNLIGFPLADAEEMPDVAANSLSIAFGDFRRGYLIVDRAGVRVIRDPFTAKPYILFYTTKRVGGGVQDFDAIKLLKFAVS
jgi:hypothetical protein